MKKDAISSKKKPAVQKPQGKRKFRWRSSYRDQPYGGVNRITNVYRGGSMTPK